MENQKRPRDPLEENSSASSELENVLKKRRLAAGGEENLDPKKSPARTRLRLAELEVKPDTPAITSIRSRVQQLSQRRDGGTGLVQRCLSDPGSEGCTDSMSSQICHIGEGEFSSRLECFKAPTPLNSPGRTTPCTRNLSSFVHGIQQQLNTAVTPSSKEASRIRQARENELRQLKVQPVAENMWLKRSLSDSSLTEEELKGSEFSSCEADSKVFDESLNTPPPCSVDIRFPNEELYTSIETGALSTSTLIDKMFEDVLQHADKEVEGEDGNKEEGVEKDESNSSETEKEDKTDSDTVEKEDEQEPVTVTLNEYPLDQSEMCEESEETPDASSATDKEKELQSVNDGEEEMEKKQESTPMGDEDFLTLPPSCILSPLSKLREGESGEPDSQNAPLQPCRGTVSISSIQLPLKVEFVCSARTGRPTHYFLVLIRYGPCNIVATPLATAADAQNGDTITFPTSITLQDIRSNFEIDVEVYSLSSTQSTTCSMNTLQFRSSTKSRVTPKKILHSITKSNQSVTSATLPGLSAQRSSNFTLVGSHKITLNSLGQSKFPLDKMKFEGKIRQLLGDEFQEKVPFLSPLEGHIYLRLHSEGHSNVQHQGFLTMFEDVSGFGAWQRFYFLLEGEHLLYWNYPNEMGNKPADGSLSLFGFCSVRPVERECCARPHTFELVETNTLQQEHSQTLKKCWFSADTREERSDWMEKLNQTLLDSLTWNRKPVSNDNRASTSSNTENSRESIL
uniref:Anillin, actin binding protein 2 n=1 Tax=Cyprinus carpio carpio TaxID=630221 RepID=A0A9J8BXY1_CYPCA